MKEFTGNLFGIAVSTKARRYYVLIKQPDDYWRLTAESEQAYPVGDVLVESFATNAIDGLLNAAWSDLKLSNPDGFEEARRLVTGA